MKHQIMKRPCEVNLFCSFAILKSLHPVRILSERLLWPPGWLLIDKLLIRSRVGLRSHTPWFHWSCRGSCFNTLDAAGLQSLWHLLGLSTGPTVKVNIFFSECDKLTFEGFVSILGSLIEDLK